MSNFGPQERVVVAFSDVFGPLPNASGDAPGLVDFDTVLNQQYGDGKFVNSQFGIGDWPSVADHGLVVLDRLREAQIGELERLGISPEEAAQAGPELYAKLRPHEAATVQSVGHQALVAVANHAPRTEELRRSGKNGGEFHYGRTKSGLEVVGHPQFFRGLRNEGRLVEESFARIPNDAAVEAGVWPKGEQYRSRFCSRLVDYPKIHEPAPVHGQNSPIGYDQRPDGGASYVDKFGNVIVGQHNISVAGAVLRENAGREVDIHLDTTEGRVTLNGVHVATNLAQAPHGRPSAYLNPADYPAGEPLPQGPGHFELAVRVDEPNDTRGSAHHQVVDALTNGKPETFRPNQWDNVNISVTPAA